MWDKRHSYWGRYKDYKPMNMAVKYAKQKQLEMQGDVNNI